MPCIDGLERLAVSHTCKTLNAARRVLFPVLRTRIGSTLDVAGALREWISGLRCPGQYPDYACWAMVEGLQRVKSGP